MSNESKTTSAFPASSDHLKSESERGHLPTMPDPSENNPEGGPHLPTMPDPGNDPAKRAAVAERARTFAEASAHPRPAAAGRCG